MGVLVSDGANLLGPPLLPSEIVNLVRKHMRRERLSLPDASEVLATFLAYDVTLIEPPGLYQQALAQTEAHSLSGQDAVYVALAQLLDIDLWTADQRLMRAISGHLSFVRFVGDYPP